MSLHLKSSIMDGKSSKKNSTSSQVVTPPPPPPEQPVQPEERSGKNKSWKKAPSRATWTKVAAVVLVVLAILTVLKSICVIAVSSLGAIAAKLFAPELSGKIAGLIVICIMAAVALSVSIYAMVAVFNKKNRHIKYAGIVLALVALIQLIITTSTLIVKENDKTAIDKDLTDSFRLSLEGKPRQTKMWANMQKTLTCCGLNGPDDYRGPNMPPFFPPDVPISCCPNYDPDRPSILQEREREVCKARKEYHKIGCLHLVEEKVYEVSVMELKVVIGYIILEALTSAAAFIVFKLRLKLCLENNSRQDEEANNK